MKDLLIFLSILLIATTSTAVNSKANSSGIAKKNSQFHSTQSLTSGMPPGLQKKGSLPKGLEGKRPHGWSEGNKQGWSKVWDSNTNSWKWIENAPSSNNIKKGKKAISN
ncbi:hypothetical protein Lade_1415 [Legionella adelaidensis]|uniref:Uncharacterized protein n=1 Tax=Legionella adelaidensis TaxID=45056 RepID=A0A0W0R2A0_9GAMM|nr:hypothetical protein [Legionella adelaidensis]KTC65232.1 hypothetical protein Lade_1415 [Legionella adelaidensis]